MRNYYDASRPPAVEPPSRWTGGLWEQQPLPGGEGDRRRKKRRPSPGNRKPRRRGLVIFLVVLALVVGCTAAVGIWSYVLRDRLPAMGEWSDGWEDWEDWDDPDPQETAETTIPRFGAGGTVRLELSASRGADLTPTEIYEKNIDSIVSITAMGDWGGSYGTGVILSEDGYIVTNAHIVEGASHVTVKLSSGREHTGFLVGMDQASDLAVLKVEADGLLPAEFGNSDELVVGESVVAIGNPLGEELRGTMTEGIISAVSRDVEMDGETMTLIQTSAALNPGNSGGALINRSGQVVGITNMKMMSSYSTIENLGFAIPTVSAKPIVDDLIAFGEVKGTPMLGVTVMETEDGVGLEVYRVEYHSDAWKQGVRRGDLIVAADGAEVNSLEDLSRAKEGLEVGDTLELTVLRGEEELTFTVALVSSNTL